MSRLKLLVDSFAGAVTRRPGRFFIAALLVVGAGTALASGLRLQSSYLALLPEGAPEVRELLEVQRQAGGTAELVIAIGGQHARRLPYARRIVQRLERSGVVQWAQAELPVSFLEERRLHLMEDRQLARLVGEVKDAVASAKARANPLYIDLEEADEGAEPAATEARAGAAPATPAQRLAQLELAQGLPEATQGSRDGRYLFVVVKPRASASELARGRQVLEQLQSEVEAARLPGEDTPVRYAGSLVTNQAENRRISRDLSLASAVALVLVIALITLSTRRAGAIVVLGVPLVSGLLLTLGGAALTTGHLNLVSGFLLAALVGMGIDFGIHLYLRFLEELQQAGGDEEAARQAMRRAIQATFGASLTSALTTSAAFLALTASSFRGFSEYGLIAGVGVLVTLGTTFVMLPPLALGLARWRALLPRRSPAGARPSMGPASSGRVTPPRGPRPLSVKAAWVLLLCSLGFLAYSAPDLASIRFYNDFQQLRGGGEELSFRDYVDRELRGSLSPALVMVNSIEELRRAHGLVEQRRRGQGERPAIARTLSLASLAPAPSPRRQGLLAELRRELESVMAAELAPEDRKAVERLAALSQAPSWTPGDVPEAFRRRLVGADGKRHFLLVWPAEKLRDDGALQRWASELDAVRGTLRQAGLQVSVLDESLLAARVLDLVRDEGPRVLLLSTLAVLALLLLDFRRLDSVALLAGTVGCGALGMLGVMALFDIHLNLYNVVVLPTVLGIGIDNAVHLRHAYQRRGRGSVSSVVSTTGRAALLSSLTTAIGFGAAILAHHRGIQCIGELALVGIACTFVASTVLLPCLLRVLEGRQQGRDASVPAAESPMHRSTSTSTSTSPRLS